MDNKHFSKALKDLRLEKELGQVTLAKALNYSKSSIGEWETGAHFPSVDALIKIAIFFDVRINFLLGLEDEFGNKIKHL